MSYNLEPRSNCRSLLSALCTRAHAHNKQSKAPTLEFTTKCGRITKIHSRKKNVALLYCLCCVKATQISEKQINNKLD